MKWLSVDHMKLYKWEWCDKCNNSWYLWRIWLFEIISLNESLRDLIREWGSSEDIVRNARKSDLILMKEDWILKALKWFTTLEEVLRVV